MSKKIFINLPVKDLDKSKEFFIKLGFKINSQFTDQNAACVVFSDNIYAMLLVKDFFTRFTKKKIINAHTSTEVLLSLSAESKEEVDKLANAAVKSGGKINRPAEDMGFMYGQSFQDLDGHIWEVFWMDKNHIQKN
jgi:uncharacterized protein